MTVEQGDLIEQEDDDGEAIAIVGMAGRFPGAGNVRELWENLTAGRSGIRPLDDAELARLPRDVREHPRHVRMQGVVDGAERFDAGYFGFNPKQAQELHPSHRFFFECAVEALEHAGLDPDRRGEGIGVFAGMESYGAEENTAGSTAEGLQHAIHTGVDYLTTHLSYLLDLRGPSVPVQTACSTSLVAVHMAVQSLLDHQCDTALAGGSSVPRHAATGYLYQEGGIYSPDGVCRTFDERAQGTVPGSGVGLVVLRRLDDALADGDAIHAVIHGTAINNDGSGKVGFTAPSIEGQRRVIEEAQAVAGVDPGQISYVECHGTATPLGDGVEIDALAQAFDEAPPGHRCALGSIKTGIGHCGAAAGIAGLIKATLCLKHATLVPSLHFERPNPRTGLGDSPFYVVTETRPWESEERWAGVSSFGIGGTNAHVVLGEAPPPSVGRASRGGSLFVLSAAGREGLERRAAEALGALDDYPDHPIGDLAYTLRSGRRARSHRWWFVAADRDEARRRLADGPADASVVEKGRKPAVAFLFPGQGRFFDDLGSELYAAKPAFRTAVDEILEAFDERLDAGPVRQLVTAGTLAAERARDPLVWQPALFTVQLATARWWQSLGVAPRALLGHSLGEYAAATLSGVLTLDGAVALVAARARGTAETAPGGMISVQAGVEEVTPWLGPEISLAAVNGPRSCVVSGPAAAIDDLQARLRDAGFEVRALESPHAFHSPLMEPLRRALDEAAAGLSLGAPAIPMVSNRTGDWLGADEATDPTYWGRQALETVRFYDGLRALAGDGNVDVTLEVGAGNVLTRLVRGSETGLEAVASAGKGPSGEDSLMRAAAVLWSRGAVIDWDADVTPGEHRRLSIVTAPFEHEVYPEPDVEDPDSAPRLGGEPDDAPVRCWVPRWEQARVRRNQASAELAGRRCLVLDDAAGNIGRVLEAAGAQVVRVPSETLQQEDFHRLRDRFRDDGFEPDVLVQGRTLDTTGNLRERLGRTLGSTLHLARAFAASEHPPILAVLTRNHHPLGGEGEPRPEISAVAGLLRMLRREAPALDCRWLDDDLDGSKEAPAWLTDLALPPQAGLLTVAWRHGRRWIPGRLRVDPASGDASSGLRSDNSTLIVDGLSPPGLELAIHLAERGRSVILADRSFFPPRPEWDDWAANQGDDDPIRQAIEKLRPWAERIEVSAGQAGTEDRWAKLVDPARGGRSIHQVVLFDRAGIPMRLADAEIAPLVERLADRFESAAALRRVVGEKVEWILCAADPGRAAAGEIERLAFSAWLDDLADHAEGAGSAVAALDADLPRLAEPDMAEWLRVLDLTLAAGHPRLVLELGEDAATGSAPGRTLEARGTSMRRPELSTPYRAPEDDVSRIVVETLERYFGLEGIGVDDDFFELGGHSLLAVQVAEQLAETFAVELTIDVLFENPTADKMAAVLRQGPRSADDEAEVREILDQLDELDSSELEALLSE